MSPFDAISAIRQAGGEVWSEDGDLCIRGTLTPEHKAVLIEHKTDLVRLLARSKPDPDREAVRWLDALPDNQADEIVRQGLNDWDRIVGDDRLPDATVLWQATLDRLGPDFAEHLPAMRDATVRWIEPEPIEWDSLPDPIPCGTCGSCEAWWDALGSRHLYAMRSADNGEEVAGSAPEDQEARQWVNTGSVQQRGVCGPARQTSGSVSSMPSPDRIKSSNGNASETASEARRRREATATDGRSTASDTDSGIPYAFSVKRRASYPKRSMSTISNR